MWSKSFATRLFGNLFVASAFLIGITAGNVGQDKKPDVAHRREGGRFLRGEMSVVARNARVAIQKRGFDRGR
jgi:hypothetical protein